MTNLECFLQRNQVGNQAGIHIRDVAGVVVPQELVEALMHRSRDFDLSTEHEVQLLPRMQIGETDRMSTGQDQRR